MELQVSYCAFYKPEMLYNADHFYLYLHTNVPVLHKCTRIKQQHSCCYKESCSSLDEDIEYCQGVRNKAFAFTVAELPEK